MTEIGWLLEASEVWRPFAARLAVTLLHSLWQGALAALVLAIALRLMRESSSNHRYVAACLGLACLLISAMATFALAPTPQTVATPSSEAAAEIASVSGVALPDAQVGAAAREAAPPAMETRAPVTAELPAAGEALTAPIHAATGVEEATQANTAPHLTLDFSLIVSAAYALGVGLMLLRTMLSLWRGYRIRRAADPCDDPLLLDVVGGLAKSLKMRVAPSVAYCERIAIPAVAGLFKPVILLPPALAANLAPHELAAILSHEIAHIRRHDLLLNLLQRVVESLLFFHPATWWISRQVSAERENCCDDVAAACGADHLQYAAALLRMAELCIPFRDRAFAHQVALLSASGAGPTELTRRVERLLRVQTPPPLNASRLLSAAIVLAVVFGCGSLGVWAQLRDTDAPVDNAPIASAGFDGEDEDGSGQTPRVDEPTPEDTPAESVAQPVAGDPIGAPRPIWWKRIGDRTAWAGKSGPQVLDERRVLIGESVFDLRTGAKLDQFDFSKISPFHQRLSENRRYLVVSGLFPVPKNVFVMPPVVVQVWDLATKKKVAEFSPSPDPFVTPSYDAAVSNDGATVVVGQYRRVTVWNSVTEKEAAPSKSVRRLDGLGISPDGKWIVISDTNRITYWEWKSKEPPKQLQVGRRIVSFAFSPDSRYLAEGPDSRKDIRVRDLASMEVVHSLSDDAGSPLFVYEMRFTSDGRTLYAGNGITVDESKLQIPHRLFAWDLPSGRLTQKIAAPKRYVHAMDVSPSGMYVAARLNELNGSLTAVWRTGIETQAEPVDDSTVWGQPVDGLRIGIRPSNSARRGSPLRHGDLLDYNVLVRNESNETVHISRSPLQRDQLSKEGDQVNLTGSYMHLSFAIHPQEFEKATLTVKPGETRQLLYFHSVSAVVRPVDTPPNRYGIEPLKMKPGEYSVFAKRNLSFHVGDERNPEKPKWNNVELQSGVTKLKVLPPARLQFRRITAVGGSATREYAAGDKNLRIERWTPPNGDPQDVIIDSNLAVLLDQDDILAVHSFDRGDPSNSKLNVTLRRSAALPLAQTSFRISRNKDPKMLLAVILDGELISVTPLEEPIKGEHATIPCSLTTANAERLARYLAESALHMPRETKWSRATDGVKVGVKMIRDERRPRMRLDFAVKNDLTEPMEISIDGEAGSRRLAAGQVLKLGEQFVQFKDGLAPSRWIVAAELERQGKQLQIATTVVRELDGSILSTARLEYPRAIQIASRLTSASTDDGKDDDKVRGQGEAEGKQPPEDKPSKQPAKPERLFGERLNVRDVRFDRHGKTVVSVATEGGVTIRTWDVATGERLNEVALDTETHGNRFLTSSMQLTGDGKRLITIVKNEVRLWDTATGKLLATLPKPEGHRSISHRVLAAVWGGQVVAGATQIGLSGFPRTLDCDVLVWETETNKLIGRLTHPDATQITALAFSSEGDRIASGSQSGTTCVFETEQGKLLYTVTNDLGGEKHPDPKVNSDALNQSLCLAFSPDGKWLAIGDMLGVNIVDAETGKRRQRFKLPFRFGRSGLVFSSDSRFLARVATDKKVPIWSMESGELVLELPTEAHAGRFSRQGRLFVAGFTDRNEALSLWRLPDMFQARVANKPKGLGFLAPYPQLQGVSLGMTRQDFLKLAKRKSLKLQPLPPKDNQYLISTGDGYAVIVMFEAGTDRCSGIQRIRHDK